MRNLTAWTVLLAIFVLAGAGLNLFRIHIVSWLAYGHAVDGVLAILGLVIAFLATAFLGGYIYYRDRKRGKLQREGWRGRPVHKKSRPRQQ